MTHENNHSLPTHQRLDAYRIAMRLYRGVEDAAREFPTGYADLKEQLRRSAGSVVRNIAEGANRWHPRDKVARFLIARGEAGECEASLEMAQVVGAIDFAEAVRLRGLAARTTAILGGLVRCQQRLE